MDDENLSYKMKSYRAKTCALRVFKKVFHWSKKHTNTLLDFMRVELHCEARNKIFAYLCTSQYIPGGFEVKINNEKSFSNHWKFTAMRIFI